LEEEEDDAQPFSDDGVSPLFGMFQVDLDNFLDIKFAIMYHMRLQPSEIEKLPYYEFEWHVKKLAEILKKKKDAEDKETNAARNNGNSSDVRKAMQNVSKQSSGWKPPSFKMPGR